MNPLAAYANPSIRNYAVKTGQMVTKIPLKDNTDAYLMTNDKSCEVFLLKGKEIVGGKGFRSTNSLEHAKFFKETILELQEHAKTAQEQPTTAKFHRKPSNWKNLFWGL